MKNRLKTNGFIIFIVSLFIVIFPNVFFRDEKTAISYALDLVMEIFGLAFILLGQILRVSARGYKAENSQSSNLLIQGGPYALVRNPMYLGILLIGFGIVFMLFQWWVITIFLLVFIMRYILLIFQEEKKLLSAFPEEFRDYQKRVPRLLPSLATVFQKDITEYLPLKFIWLKKEVNSIVAVLLGVLIVESWDDIKKRQVAIYLKEALAFLIIIIIFVSLGIYLAKHSKNFKEYASDKGRAA